MDGHECDCGASHCAAQDRIRDLEYAVKEQQQINLFCQEEEEKNLARIGELERYWNWENEQYIRRIAELEEQVSEMKMHNEHAEGRIAELETGLHTVATECAEWQGRAREFAIRIAELEQALWDCAGAAGADLDGDPTPVALKHPDICTFALNAVTSLREDYDAALAELDSRESADYPCAHPTSKRIAELETTLAASRELVDDLYARIAELEVTVDHWRVRCAELEALLLEVRQTWWGKETSFAPNIIRRVDAALGWGREEPT